MTDQARQTLSRMEFEQRVAQRAREDAAFRAQLLADPKRTLKKAFEVDVPDAVELTVVQESPSRMYLVLPADPAELSDGELGAVAGGVAVVPQSTFGLSRIEVGSAAASGTGLGRF